MVQRGKKLLSLLLTAAMVASLVVVPAFATDTPDTTGTTGEAQDKDKNNEGGGSEGTPQGAGRKADEASGATLFQEGDSETPPTEEDKDTQATPITGGEFLGLAKNGVITLEQDYVLTSIVRVSDSNVEIKGNGHSITRSSEFARTQDQARGGYHGAMFEVNGSLTLNNVILDDNNVVGGGKGDQKITNPVFKQAEAGENPGDNTSCVQDAIIASYSGTGNITLGEGTVLKNFGGMSAVRITGVGGTLTMESGSSIEGGGTTSKNKDEKGKGYGTGAAGAVWIQGGTLVMKEGSKITGTTGRAIYADGAGSEVKMDGTISNITYTNTFWNAVQGIAIHLRGGANGTIDGTIDSVAGNIGWNDPSEASAVHVINGGDLTLNGAIKNIQVTGNSTAAAITIRDESCNTAGENGGDTEYAILTMGKDAVIDNVAGNGIQAFTPRGGSQPASSKEGDPLTPVEKRDRVNVTVDGKISKVGGTAIYTNADANAFSPYGVCTGEYIYVSIGQDAQLTENNIAIGGQGCNYTVGGTITRNKQVASFWSNCTQALVTLTETARVTGNSATGDLFALGNTILIAKNGSQITGNDCSGSGSVISVNAGSQFQMENGAVINSNTNFRSSIKYNAGSTFIEKTSFVDPLAGGSITNSGVLTIGSGTADMTHYFTVPTTDITKDGNSVYFMTDAKTVQVVPGTKLGNASYNKDSKGNETGSVAELNTAAKTYGLKDAFATFWTQNTNGTPVSVKMNDPAGGEAAKFDATKPVYVLTQATDEKGAPAMDAGFNLLPATVKDGTISFNLPDTGKTGCAVALVQPDNANGTLTITTGVTELTEGQESYEIPYTLSFAPTSATEAVTEVTVEIFSPLDGEKTVKLTKNETGDIWTGTWTGTLAGTAFKAGESIVTGAVATIDAGAADTKPIYADGVSILMKALNTYTVTFNSNGGSAVPSQTITEGSAVTQPAAPTRDGYTFNGWRIEGATENYNFTTPVTSDLTLVAQWTQNSGGGGTGGGGGGGGGGIDIPDDPTPLGGDLQLNREDHFAYVSGYPDSSVQPGGHITREEVATIFYRLLTEQSKAIYGATTNNFNDVEAERWSNEAISTLANAQVLQGYADGGFHPGDPITRAEFTAIVTRFDEVDSAPASPFSDTAGHWAEDVIAFAASKNWVGGYPDGSFRPQSDITRAEAMTMINNILDRLVDEEGILAEARQWPDNAKDAWYYYAVQEATNAHDYTRRSADGIVENWTALR